MISTPSAVGLVGAVDIELEVARGIEIELRNARGLELSEVWRELETAPASWILRSFSTSMSSLTVEPVPMPSTMPSLM